MRKMYPNFDREEGLDTVLEVPIPEEVVESMGSNKTLQLQNMHQWLKNKSCTKLSPSPSTPTASSAELHLLLNVLGSPLIPVQVESDHAISRPVKDGSIEASTAKYITQQYVAATGGQAALNALKSMYVMGMVRMGASEFRSSEEDSGKIKGNGEVGGFVLWQKNPDLWVQELVVSGCKISAGSDGKLSWRQLATQQSHASKGPPRPLRRFFQGLDPKSTANLFLDAVCVGEKIINTDECFILKLDVSPTTLKARSTKNLEIIHHTIWGYFSQRTGLLVKFEDSHLVRMSSNRGGHEQSVFWETSMESMIEDYKYVDAINIAHSGQTKVTLFRYGTGSVSHKRRLEESWRIEEVDFNIWGLSKDCFLAPADLKKDHE